MTSKMPVLKITKMAKIAKDVYEMVLEGDVSENKKPGQFINISIDGFYLRRPISITDISQNDLTIIFKVLGKGTEKLAEYKVGDKLEILSGLGNGFDLNLDFKKPIIVGGGVGTPPLFWLAKDLIKKGFKPDVVLGFASKDDIFYKDEFEDLGLNVYIATNDGSYGTKGFVTEIVKNLDYDYLFSCGPVPMLKALHGITNKGQFSFEERMACGFGACMCCTCQTKDGTKRICKDGPVLFGEGIVW